MREGTRLNPWPVTAQTDTRSPLSNTNSVWQYWHCIKSMQPLPSLASRRDNLYRTNEGMRSPASSLIWSQIANPQSQLESTSSSVLLETEKLYWQRKYSSLAKIRASVEKCSSGPDLQQLCPRRDWDKAFNERPCSGTQKWRFIAVWTIQWLIGWGGFEYTLERQPVWGFLECRQFNEM